MTKRETLSDEERLKILLGWRSTLYQEAQKVLEKYNTLHMTELEAMADLMGFEFNRHDSRSMEEVIDDECPKKYRAKLHDRLTQVRAVQDSEWDLYQATHEGLE